MAFRIVNGQATFDDLPLPSRTATPRVTVTHQDHAATGSPTAQMAAAFTSQVQSRAANQAAPVATAPKSSFLSKLFGSAPTPSNYESNPYSQIGLTKDSIVKSSLNPFEFGSAQGVKTAQAAFAGAGPVHYESFIGPNAYQTPQADIMVKGQKDTAYHNVGLLDKYLSMGYTPEQALRGYQ